MKTLFSGFAPTLIVGLLLGCLPLQNDPANSSPQTEPVSPQREPNIGLVDINYAATDSLLGNLRVDLSTARPILVASIVNIDNLEQTSTLGRLIAEQIGARLSQNGYFIQEIKLRNSVVVREGGGEFILSRDFRHLVARYDAQAIVTGTYARGKDEIYINLRMIQASNNQLISTFDYVLRTTRNVRSLVDPYYLSE